MIVTRSSDPLSSFGDFGSPSTGFRFPIFSFAAIVAIWSTMFLEMSTAYTIPPGATLCAISRAISPLPARYLNRLSDLLFILSRAANAGHEDVLWKPGGDR